MKEIRIRIIFINITYILLHNIVLSQTYFLISSLSLSPPHSPHNTNLQISHLTIITLTSATFVPVGPVFINEPLSSALK